MYTLLTITESNIARNPKTTETKAIRRPTSNQYENTHQSHEKEIELIWRPSVAEIFVVCVGTQNTSQNYRKKK